MSKRSGAHGASRQRRTSQSVRHALVEHGLDVQDLAVVDEAHAGVDAVAVAGS